MPDLDTSDVNTTDSGSTASPDVAASSADASASSSQGAAVGVSDHSPDQQATVEQDPLEGVPSLEELQGKEGVPYAKALAQLRPAYESLSAQHKELGTKYQTFEPFADRFQSSDDIQSLVTLNESLNKYSQDSQTGELIPDPSEFVKELTTNDSVRADYLNSQLLWSQVQVGVDHAGQPVLQTRAETFLQAVAEDPGFRSRALQILGGVEPSSIPAPTWTPTQEELDRIDDPANPTAEGKALQELYKKLSYEQRDELRVSSPEFVKDHLRTKQINDRLLAESSARETRDREQAAQQEQQIEQQATAAGEQYVEQGFKEGFTNFANHIFETWKPTDNPVINKREGAQVALAVVALSHPDTRFAAEQAFKEMGIDQKALDNFNAAREAYANQGRQHGYLTHKKMRTTEDPSRAQQRLIAQANNLATLITKGRDEYFQLRATSNNNELDQAATARLPIGGSPSTSENGSGNRFIQAGKRTESEIWGR